MLVLIVLLASLSGVAGHCLNQSDPLILQPPELVGEFGQSYTVTCSTNSTGHDSIFWSDGDEAAEQSSNASLNLLLSDWDAQLRCYLVVEDGNCSKELPITVYQNPERVSVHPLVDSVQEGTLFEARCLIRDVAPLQNLTVSWYKNDLLISTDSFNSSSRRPQNASSLLSLNISREDDRVSLRCEARLDFGPLGPQTAVVSSDNVSISVTYLPAFPQNNKSVPIEKGEDVHLQCEAEGNPPPTYTWLYRGAAQVEQSGGNFTIRGEKQPSIVSCIASNPLGNATKGFFISMTNTRPAPSPSPSPEAWTEPGCPLTLTPPKLVVAYGDPASANCSTSTTDHLEMGWGAPPAGTYVSGDTTVVWKVERVDVWTMRPTCNITPTDDEDDRQCSKTLNITIYKVPDVVYVSLVDHAGPLIEDTEYMLNCSIVNVSTVLNLKVNWYKGSENISTQVLQGPQGTLGNVSSSLRIVPTRGDTGAEFKCEAELDLGPDGPPIVPRNLSEALILPDVHYAPLIDCPCQVYGLEDDFSLDMANCSVSGNPPPAILWYRQDTQVNASMLLNRTHTGQYRVEAVNHLSRTNATVQITVAYAPSISCNAEFVVVENTQEQPKCVTEGLPEPIISWSKGGMDLAEIKQWTRTDKGEYILKATNRYGTANCTIRVDVLYAPEIKPVNDVTESPGANVSLECSAEGNPVPKVKWEYTHAANIFETTRGHQKVITVSRATSTNAGNYMCVAENEVGSRKSLVTLIITDQRQSHHGMSTTTLIVIVIMVLISSVFILLLVCHKLWKKRGQYNLIASQDFYTFPMTAQTANGHSRY